MKLNIHNYLDTVLDEIQDDIIFNSNFNWLYRDFYMLDRDDITSVLYESIWKVIEKAKKGAYEANKAALVPVINRAAKNKCNDLVRAMHQDNRKIHYGLDKEGAPILQSFDAYEDEQGINHYLGVVDTNYNYIILRESIRAEFTGIKKELLLLLLDTGKLSNRELAQELGVSHTYINKLMIELKDELTQKLYNI